MAAVDRGGREHDGRGLVDVRQHPHSARPGDADAHADPDAYADGHVYADGNIYADTHGNGHSRRLRRTDRGRDDCTYAGVPSAHVVY
jgi:hypothetical protein